MLAPAGVLRTLPFAQGSLKVCGIQTGPSASQATVLGFCTEHQSVLFAGKVTNAAHLKLVKGHSLKMTQICTSEKKEIILLK